MLYIGIWKSLTFGSDLIRVEKNLGFMSIAQPSGKTRVFPGFTGQYRVILDLIGLLHKKTDFNYFIKSTSVIKWSVIIRNDNIVTD